MAGIPPLEMLGRRICIIGPSNSGKSTLAAAVGRRLGVPVVHLDQLHHLPHTDWQPRPREEFAALHAEAIAGEAWVIDGNYSKLFAPRFARATGFIVLRGSRITNFLRYLRRTWFERERAGHLAGARERLTWQMTHWVLVTSPNNRSRYLREIAATGLPVIELPSTAHVKAACDAWGLDR